ncbi:Copia protein, partial [Mucuna pruriens]
MFLGNALISWKYKKQNSISKSSIEAKYHAMSTTCSKIIWLRGFITKFGFPQAQPTQLHADNTTNPVYHERTKLIEVDCHLIQEAYDRRVISPPHVLTSIQTADILTKSLTHQ